MITEEKRKRVVHLYFDERKSYREIAKEERMSLRDVTDIIKEAKGEEPSSKKEDLPDLSSHSAKIYRLFTEGKSPTQVAILLNLPLKHVKAEYLEYMSANGLHRLTRTFQEKGDPWLRATNQIGAAMTELGLDSSDAVGFLEYTWKMQKAGYSLQKAKEEEAQLDQANFIEVLRLTEQQKEHEEKLSRLSKEKGKTVELEPAKTEPKTSQSSAFSDVNNMKKGEDPNQRFWEYVDALYSHVNIRSKQKD